jgi:CheY-like chemotaxis protein
MTTLKALLVEDELLVSMVASDYLSELGYDVVETASAQSALDQLKIADGCFDLAVVDLGLPDRLGEELVAEILALYPRLPVVIASGSAPTGLRERSAHRERIAIVIKPYQQSDLEVAIGSLGPSKSI